MNWEPLNLRALPERDAITPTIGGLVYPGRRHIFSGPPESAKTFAAFGLAIEELRRGSNVLHVDFEMFAQETRERLREMGVTDDELDSFLHVEPETPASDEIIAGLVEEWEPSLAIIDAAAGAFGLHALDDNKRGDAETFAAYMIEPFRARGVATVLLDHVTKNAEGRGRFAIGSERKVGGADVHLGFEPVTPFGRGRNGLVRIVTHKDRFGHLPRPRAAMLELHSDPETHAITWAFTQAGEDEAQNQWRPTVLMERVSRYLEAQSDGVPINAICRDVKGRREYLLDAVRFLVSDGYATEAPGNHGSRLVRLVKPFRDRFPTGSQRFPEPETPTGSPVPPAYSGEPGTGHQLLEEMRTAPASEKGRRLPGWHRAERAHRLLTASPPSAPEGPCQRCGRAGRRHRVGRACLCPSCARRAA